jgi:hypothetical protein
VNIGHLVADANAGFGGDAISWLVAGRKENGV